MSHEGEYFAIRHSAGLIDVSPLLKYEIYGPDAALFLSRLTVKNVARLKIGRVTYLCWCDDAGKVVDDGTVSRLDDDYFRLTAAEPSLSWLERMSRSYRVTIEDSSARLGTLALQGPGRPAPGRRPMPDESQSRSSGERRRVLGESLLLLAVGSVIGVAAALAAGQWIESLLYGTRATDPGILSLAVGVLAVVTLTAAYVPARRASRIDPSAALRYE